MLELCSYPTFAVLWTWILKDSCWVLVMLARSCTRKHTLHFGFTHCMNNSAVCMVCSDKYSKRRDQNTVTDACVTHINRAFMSNMLQSKATVMHD